MRRPLILTAGLVLVASACTTDGTPDVGPGTTSQPPTTAAPGPATVDVSDLPGRLVVLDDGGDIVTIDPDGSDPVSITDDAGESARYAQPSFSPVTDTLAWAEITPDGTGLGSSDGRGEDRVSIPMNAPPFFMYWSPDGNGIGVLHNSVQGTIEFEIVDVGAGTTEVVASGAPFYFSWSPDSTQVAVHVQLEVFAALDRDGNQTDLGATAPGYQAPHWTESGIIHLGASGLELRDPSGGPRILATAPGPVAFVTNPQGTRVAVQSFVEEDRPGINATLSETPALPSNSVVILDVASGDVVEVTQSLSVGLFWSPDGEALLVLKPNDDGSGDLDVLMWRGGETTELLSMAPHPAFVEGVLQFFDQYGQSLQIWSPDSSAVALAGAVDNEQGVWVQSVAGGDPVRVFEGSWAAWSNG